VVRPALFWMVGQAAGRRLTEQQSREVELKEENVASHEA